MRSREANADWWKVSPPFDVTGALNVYLMSRCEKKVKNELNYLKSIETTDSNKLIHVNISPIHAYIQQFKVASTKGLTGLQNIHQVNSYYAISSH